MGAYENDNWNKLFPALRYWLQKAKDFQYKNNHEYENLSEAICTVWECFNSKDPSLGDEDEFEKLILEEDIETIIK